MSLKHGKMGWHSPAEVDARPGGRHLGRCESCFYVQRGDVLRCGHHEAVGGDAETEPRATCAMWER